MSKLICGVCGHETEMPNHCGTPLKPIMSSGNIEMLVCEACGNEVAPPKHHNTVMGLKE